MKCDIRKFFGNINHEILIRILEKYIPDENIMWLLREVISSFPKDDLKIGLPLGNLTSHLFVNIYMNEFDQYIKHKHKAEYYIRYADDFVILSENRDLLAGRIKPIKSFLKNELKLELHPQKISIKTFASGNDFLGWVHFSAHRVLRTAAKRRMFRRIKANPKEETINSYLGLLSHGNTHKIQSQILEKYSFPKE